MTTKAFAWTASGAILLGCLAAAAGQTTAPAAPPPAASTRPAVAVPAPPDLCTGAIDPYEEGPERERFFKAAGVDGELDEKEFAANAGKADAFVRKFDRWEAIRAFDKNKNKTIDWFEAEAYRKNIRQRLLAVFDANKDKKLLAEERARANAALASGRIPGSGPGGGSSRRGGGRWQPDAETLRRHDADGNGELSREERIAMYRARIEEYRRQRLAQAAAGGGVPDERRPPPGETEPGGPEERRPPRPGEAEPGGPDDEQRRAAARQRIDAWRQYRDEWGLRHFDTNGDGRLDERENAEVRAFQEAFRQVGHDAELIFNDIDGDGEVTREERERIRQEWSEMRWRVMARVTRLMDADGDGQLSPEETMGFRRRAQEAAMRWIDGFTDRFDGDRNGRLDPSERAALLEGFHREIETRARRADANRDGWVEPSEALRLMEDLAQDMGIIPRRPDRPDGPDRPDRPEGPPERRFGPPRRVVPGSEPQRP